MPNEANRFDTRTTSAPDLAEVRQPDDGGAISFIGTKYQYHFAAYKCLQMLLDPERYEYVASELQDDVAVKLRDSKYEFYQVKQKRNEQWKINTLHSEGVWQRFWRLQKEFGYGHSYFFVSDQSAQPRVSNKPDLGRMKALTDNGRARCNELELIQAGDLIDKLMGKLDITDRGEVEKLFWSIRILTGFERQKGLVASNVQLLEQLLEKRRIVSDSPNRMRIYRRIISVLEASVAEPPLDVTHRERLELRKIDTAKLEECLKGPFKDKHLRSFSIDDGEAQQRDLRSKSREANFPENIVRYFIECHNCFHIRYRQDILHAAAYLSELRLKVWDVCSGAQVSAYVNGFDSPLKTYDTIRSELKQLATLESNSTPPIAVDFDYLHGMMCQLTAECDNEWYPIG
jgi:hypothetical protein